MFVMANLARHLKVDPETALRRANAKFERRFRAIENALKAQDRSPEDATLAEMDAALGSGETGRTALNPIPTSP